MFGINLQQVLSFVRWALTLATGWAVGKGYLTADLAASIAAVVLGLVPLLWGFVTHTDANAVTTAAAVIEKTPNATAAAPVIGALRVAGASVNTAAMPQQAP